MVSAAANDVPDWVPDAIFYEILPDRHAPPSPERLVGLDASALEPWEAPAGRFAYKGGDLWGVIGDLDRLVELGVTALYLTPIQVGPTYHRYKPQDFFRVDPMLGGDAAFQALLAETRRRGLRVMLDAVFNHVHVGHRAFADIVEYGEKSPYRDWFHVHEWPVNPTDDGRPPTYRVWKGNRTMPVLNHRNPGVREHLMQAAEHWARQGIDAFRFDAGPDIEADGFWEEMRERLRRINPELYLMGEVWTDPSRWLGGHQWDGATNYPFLFSARVFAAGGRLRPDHAPGPGSAEAPIDAAEYARRVELFAGRHPWKHVLAQLNFVDGHDVARLVTAVEGDQATIELAHVLLFTHPGPSCLYYGQEVGLEGGLPPDSRRGFPPVERWDRALLEQVTSLIGLRRSHRALRRGEIRTLHARRGLYIMARRLDDDVCLVAVNAGDEPDSARLEGPQLAPHTWPTEVCYGAATAALEGNGSLRLAIGARRAAVLARSADAKPWKERQ